MSTGLEEEILNLLTAIQAAQQELGNLYQQKREAIRRADIESMNQLLDTEQCLIARLETLLRQRNRILQRETRPNGPATSLEELVLSMSAVERDRLLPRIKQTRQAADANRRESWIVWIVAKQSLRLFGETLDLIAHGGRKAPVYSARPDADVVLGGTLLDASA